MVWDGRKIAIIAGLGVLFLVEICLGVYILFPSTPALPEIATLPVTTTQLEQPAEILTEQPIITPTQTTEPVPTQVSAATPTDILPITLSTICLPQDTGYEHGLVTNVIDGDTIEVEINEQRYPVRYIGMDTPEETSQVELYGYKASQRNSDLVLDKEVVLVKDVSETDRYDRLLRYVLVGATFVNYVMVEDGFAEAVSYPPDIACDEAFWEAEQIARAECRGFWCPTATSPSPTLPPPTVPPPPPAAPTQEPSNCHPSYPDVCLLINQGDYDCAGGSGNGPNYVRGPLKVLPPDPYDLDRDGDGIGCE